MYLFTLINPINGKMFNQPDYNYFVQAINLGNIHPYTDVRSEI